MDIRKQTLGMAAARHALISASLGLALTACGGGSGGDDGISPPGVTIDPARDPMTIEPGDVEQVALASIQGGAVFDGTNPDDFIPFSSSTTPPSSALEVVQALVLRYLVGDDSPKTATLSGATQVESCDLGQGSVAYTEEGNEALIEFNNCRIDDGYTGGYDIFDGALYLSGSESGGGCSYLLNGLMVFGGFTTETYDAVGTRILSLGMNGRFNFTATGDDYCTDQSFRLYGPAWEVIIDGERLAYYDFDITSGTTGSGTTCTEDYQATIDDSTLAGSLTVSTPTTVEGECLSDYPYTGELLIEGADEARVRVTINTGYDNANAVTVDVDLDGNGVSDAPYPLDMSWDELEAAAAP